MASIKKLTNSKGAVRTGFILLAITNGKHNGAVKFGLVLALAIAFVLVFSQTSYASLTFSGRDCNGNTVCDVLTRCDANGCTTSFENCQSCGATTKPCPDGVATAPNKCDKSSGAPQCIKGTPVCTAAQSSGVTDPYVILTFQVFTKKNLLITVTPPSQTGLAGSTLNYKISFENKNPKSLLFKISSDMPPNWQINIPTEVTLGANSKQEISFRVTSNATASDGTYPILIGVFNSELNLFGSATANYIVASRGAPTLSTVPKSQAGYPGASLMYNVSVTNNDPADFDASTISLKADDPDGFNSVFTPASIKLKPKETGYVRLDVTSPLNATEAIYPVTINATANKLSASEFIEYRIDFCGNTVCEVGEEGSCLKDCPNDPNFACNGRCETELDDGLAFSATVNVEFKRFVVCSRNSTLQTCLQAARTAATANASGCGIGKACLCVQAYDARSASVASCNTRCVDTKGVYFLAANGSSNVRSIANYSFACPFVDLPEIIDLRDNFSTAKQDYEKAQSALRETLRAPNVTTAKKAEGQPCVDALTSIIIVTGDFVNYLNDVIAWPGKLNTTAARGRAPLVRSNIEGIYNTFCRGASGLLQIEGITAAPVEKGQTGQLDVAVKNIGNIRYSGYVQCDLTGATGERASLNSSCTIIGTSETFQFPFNASSAGSWRASCKAFGSLNDCLNASLHHELAAAFNVTTRDTFVVDLAGACAGSNATLTCSIRTSQPGCGSCTANGQACSSIANTNGTETFNCPKAAYGNYTLIGSVQTNNRCMPVPPAMKNITVRCPGCGDGILDANEQCEPAFSNDNQKCSQAQSTCEGRLYGVRDRVGFCTAGCECSYDQYEFSCTRGQCSAECGDGETRTVTINTTTGSCSCVQQCGSGCSWLQCGCEPGVGPTGIPGAPTAPTTGRPFIEVTHSPDSPTASTQVTITARGGNFTRAEIYVDGFVVKTCPSSPCAITATYAAGVHSYYARASNSISVVTDPENGAKSFTVSGATAPVGNRTTTTNASVSLTTSHSPQNPITTDTVTVTAVASVNADRVEIYVDGALAKQCTDFVCSYSAQYSAGTHTYFALAFDGSDSVANPTTGTKSFTVTQAAAAGQPGNLTTTTNATVSLTTSHSPQNPTTADTVTITAIASANANRVQVYVDGSLAKQCTDFVCSYSAQYSAGTHTYFATAFDSTASVADPATGTKSFMVTQAAQPGQNVTQPVSGGQANLSTTSVIVDISHSPQAPTTDDFVVLTAVAHGPNSFKQINIFVDDSLRKTCQDYAPSQPCTFRATYSEGAHSYFATAMDIRNVSARDPSSGSKGFSVTKFVAPTEPAPPPIIGVTPVSGTPSAPAAARARCYAKIDAKNCTYNSITRRYDVSLSASWDNGTHAHSIIDDNTGPKMYVKNFSRTEPLSAPGLKNVQVVVHDVNDTTLCFDSGDIYCGPGSSAGKDVDIIFDAKNVVKTGTTDIRVIFISYSDASGARLQSWTDAAANVSAVRIEGNITPAGISSSRIAGDKPYNVYTITTSLSSKRNISVLYRLRMDAAGEYKLLASANYSGKFVQAAKTIKATTCDQAYSILGRGPSGACVEFATPCDMPPGWVEVPSCPDEEAPPAPEESPFGLVLLILVLIVLLVLAYKYRDRIKERLHREPKERLRRGAEELPSFEE